MKIIFTGIILLHALIHLAGFVRAFDLFLIKGFSVSISKAWGILWLAACLLLLVTAVLYYAENSYWVMAGILAVVVSQLLIIVFRKDAGYGTVLNILILGLLIKEIGNRHNLVISKDKEAMALSAGANTQTGLILEDKDLTPLPPAVQTWLRHSGAVGKPIVQTIQLTQKCLLKMKPGQTSWYEAEASQLFSVNPPGFVWKVKMNMGSLLSVTGRDKLEKGQGAMLMSLASVWPVVDVKHNSKLNEGTLQRYLGEIVWFPSAAVSSFIHWEGLDEHSARATIQSEQTTASGIFYFDEQGKFLRYVCERYMNSDANANRYLWEIKAEKYETLNGVLVPVELSATWHLENRNWTWAKFQITSISYQP